MNNLVVIGAEGMDYIGGKVLQYKEEIIYHVQKLIQIQSVATEPLPGKPSGEGVHQALEYVLELGRSLGFHAISVDGYAGHIEYGQGSELAAVLVHVDTVPLGDGWTYPPLEARVVEGAIYGRGASDNKHAVVTAVYSLYALKVAGIIPKRRIRVIIGTREETGMTDMDYYFEREPLPDYGFVTDGGYPIANAEKGSYIIEFSQALKLQESWLECEAGEAPNVIPDYAEAWFRTGAQITGSELAKGKAGHGAFPHSGVNAIAKLLEKLSTHPNMHELAVKSFVQFASTYIGLEVTGQTLGIAYKHSTYGEVTVNIGQLSIQRDQVSMVLDIRYPVGTNKVELIHSLQQIATQANINMAVMKDLPELYVEPESELIRRLSDAYEKVTGQPAELYTMAGGTYAKKLRNTGVIFGPTFPDSPPTNFHKADEHIRIDHMLRHAEVCTQALYELSR